VLGFLKKDGQFQSFVFEGSVDSSVVVACFDEFAKQINPDKTTFVIVDTRLWPFWPLPDSCPQGV
jgi:hypothetical protein